MIQQLINNEQFTNIQKAQSGLTRLFEKAKKDGSFFRVMKNDTSLGVLLPDDMWRSLIEDIEALSSPSYKASIQEARAGKKRYSLAEVQKSLT